MTRTIAEIRELAKRHEEEILSVRWLTPVMLAARWSISLSTVYEIPFDQLRFKAFGQGKKFKRRRYKPEWVEAYETLSGMKEVDASMAHQDKLDHQRDHQHASGQ